MKYEVPGTRAFYESAPQSKVVSHAHGHTPSVAINCTQFKSNCGHKHPDKEALEFYALNHLAAIVRKNFTPHEKLPDWAVQVMDAYLKCLVAQGQRLFFYTLLIVTRESRHIKNAATATWKEKFVPKFGEVAYDFNLSIKGSSSDGAVTKFLSNPPAMPLGPYLDSLVHIFDKGSFSGGYGGKPWANIAATIAAFVNGKTSLEMMVDTAYTLAHNNGPMFNKGMMYHMYTNDIYKVLDVQRSGQVPELMIAGTKHLPASHIDTTVQALCQMVKQKFPNEIGDYVDWYKVESLGALHTYPKEKKAQDAMVPPKPAEPAKTKDGKFLLVGEWEAFPGQKVPVYTRKAKSPAHA